MGERASRTWQELSGSEDWRGLLEPQLDEDLRMYLLQYGEKGQAIVDAFNSEDASQARGFSRYPKDGFFSSVGLPSAKYEVTRFIYAWASDKVNWIAYVAVSTDGGTEVLPRRDILVVWGPTWSSVEAALDSADTFASAKNIFGNDHEDVKVHGGWLAVYTASSDDNSYTMLSARKQVLAEVKKQVEAYKNEEISITVVGHGMGGALAMLNAMDIVANDYSIYPAGSQRVRKACQVTVFAFASPKVGNKEFKDLFDTLNKDKNLHALRIFNAVDVVPNVPPVDYVHVGEQLVVDCRKSPYLKPIGNGNQGYSQIAHQLEPLLHVVAGWKGLGIPFNLKNNRDLSLANKHMDALAARDIAPASWWVVEKKGMVPQVQANGKVVWKLDDKRPQPPS